VFDFSQFGSRVLTEKLFRTTGERDTDTGRYQNRIVAQFRINVFS
jgi:hypothetical protein